MSKAPLDKGIATPCRFIAPNLVACDSWRGQEKSYIQDLEARSCSCPDFQHRRAEKGPHEEGRLCKHLAALLQPEPPAAPSEDQPRVWKSVKTFGPTTEAEMYAQLGGRR